MIVRLSRNTARMPEEASQLRPFREFLYVDVDRVRGLLAQIDGGVVDTIIERQSDRSSGVLGARIFGVQGSKERVEEGAVEWTRTLDDAMFSLLEEAAEQANLLRDVPELKDISAWADGRVHEALAPGQLVRVEGATQIVDPPHVREELIRALGAVEAYARFEEATNPTPMPPTPSGRTKPKPKDFEAWHEAVIDQRILTVLGGVPLDAVGAAAAMLERLLGEAISLRTFPCGAARSEYVLSGSLADRPGYFRDERGALFAKFGWAPATWTVVAQIGTVPLAHAASDQGPDDENANSEDIEPGRVRATMENSAVEIMGALAEAGLMDAPRYPGVTMSPIAVYRDIPIQGQPSSS